MGQFRFSFFNFNGSFGILLSCSNNVFDCIYNSPHSGNSATKSNSSFRFLFMVCAPTQSYTTQMYQTSFSWTASCNAKIFKTSLPTLSGSYFTSSYWSIACTISPISNTRSERRLLVAPNGWLAECFWSTFNLLYSRAIANIF